MSDNWIAVIPKDPRIIPDRVASHHACDRFAKMFPGADEVGAKVSEHVEFYDCGANLERICCPSCRSEISVEWWQDRMDEDSDDGFKLSEYPTSCCGATVTLNELDYDWPQGFACYALVAMNPNVGELSDEHKRELERILGTELRVVYQRI